MPFSVKVFGRWGEEAADWLRDAANAACARSPQLACLGGRGPAALLGAWHARLSVALQRGNAACVLQAGRLRGAWDLGGDTGWEEEFDELLRDCATAANAANAAGPAAGGEEASTA